MHSGYTNIPLAEFTLTAISIRKVRIDPNFSNGNKRIRILKLDAMIFSEMPPGLQVLGHISADQGPYYRTSYGVS